MAHPSAPGAQKQRWDQDASLILPRLYLTDFLTAQDEDELKRLGVTHIMSVMEYEPIISDEVIRKERRMHVPIQDRGEVDILKWLEATTKFIEKGLEDEANVVLVHCFQGISRSATVVCAYLVAAKRLQGHEAIAFVQAKRGIVCPNLGFRHQLEMYAMRYGGPEVEEKPLSFFRFPARLRERFENSHKGKSSQNEGTNFARALIAKRMEMDRKKNVVQERVQVEKVQGDEQGNTEQKTVASSTTS